MERAIRWVADSLFHFIKFSYFGLYFTHLYIIAMKTFITFTFTIIISFISNAQNYVGDKADIQQILKNSEQFSKYVMDSNYDKIAEAYTADGKIFPNNLEILEGREAIRKYWVLPEGVSTTYHKSTSHEIRVLGEFAHDHGVYEGKTKRADGTESSWRGKYVIVWQKVNGDWKMYLDIWNRMP